MSYSHDQGSETEEVNSVNTVPSFNPYHIEAEAGVECCPFCREAINFNKKKKGDDILDVVEDLEKRLKEDIGNNIRNIDHFILDLERQLNSLQMKVGPTPKRGGGELGFLKTRLSKNYNY